MATTMATPDGDYKWYIPLAELDDAIKYYERDTCQEPDCPGGHAEEPGSIQQVRRLRRIRDEYLCRMPQATTVPCPGRLD